MNVILRNFLTFVFLFSGFALFGQSIVTLNLETYGNTNVEHQFSSFPGPASVHAEPLNGSIQLTNLGSFQWEFSYTPNDDYYGPDDFELYYFSSTLKKLKVHVDVLPAKVVAVHDNSSTNAGQSVSIEVLGNDFSSNDVFILSAIPAANNGWAEFEQGTSTITFHPNPGFSGLTHFNYVVCDGAGTCDNGTVSVTVMPVETESDTLRIFTKKNLEQVVLVPDSYSLEAGWPQNGIFDNSEVTPVYIPDVDYSGMDYLYFSHDGVQTVVIIEVLDVVENVFLFNDEYFTTSAESIEFNVLDNDLYGQATGCVGFGEPEFGTLLHAGNTQYMGVGEVVYIPPSDFQGVDWFNYVGHSGGTCGSPEETARVFIHVSNFEPSSDKFYMSTPRRTPLLIGYDLPVTSYSFSILEQGALGEVLYLPGQVDTTIYGKLISGYNLLIYIPYEDVIQGEDEFEVSYCALDIQGNCAVEKSVKIEMEILNVGTGDEPMCFDDCVWRGDTNFDGAVDLQDLLPIGLSMGEIGTSRTNPNANYWYGEYADDWNGPFNTETIDLKHIDADGDSIVTALDTIAINQYYGRTHALVPSIMPFYENEIVLQGDVFVSPGDLVELEMVLGSSSKPAVDVYGFTIPFEYNPLFFVPESVSMEFTNSSWLSYNSPILNMTHNDFEGNFEGAFTRTSGISASGHGDIGIVRLVVIDDIDGFRIGNEPLQAQVGGGLSTVMNSAGQTFGMKVGGATIHIVFEQEKDFDKLNPDLLKLSPNPASDYLNIHLNGAQGFENVVVRNVTGQVVYNLGNLEGDNRAQVDVSKWASGMYFVSVYTTEGVISKKFEVID
jgi:hypothetical protein